MSSIHTTWGYVAAGISGAVGLWGVLTANREAVPKAYYWAVGAAAAGLLAQVVIGVIMFSQGKDPGGQHIFYGVVIAVAFSFAHIYRSQFSKRPTLRYGLLLLFTMGLGIRGIMTFGSDF